MSATTFALPSLYLTSLVNWLISCSWSWLASRCCIRWLVNAPTMGRWSVKITRCLPSKSGLKCRTA